MTSTRTFDIPDQPGLQFEQSFWAAGCHFVAGIDEAGRGALAGPVYAAAVVFLADLALPEMLAGVRDSKMMTARQRNVWAKVISGTAAAYAAGSADSQEIDRLGIVPATRLAAMRAVAKLGCTPTHLLLDYLFLPDLDVPQTSLVKGDRRSLSIAAASILAKTERDRTMQLLGCEYPDYGLARHKGYGTAAHLAALERHGAAPIHRKSFRRVKGL